MIKIQLKWLKKRGSDKRTNEWCFDVVDDSISACVITLMPEMSCVVLNSFQSICSVYIFMNMQWSGMVGFPNPTGLRS